MAGEVIVDALPYIDHGYDDAGVRESALAMVEEECRRYRPTKNYLDHLTPLNAGGAAGGAFETKLMTLEFDRIQSRQPMETLSMKRYELPPPSAGKLSEVAAWQESIDNSMAQLEHQWVRAMNLELMLDYGIEAWRAYLEVLVALQAKAQSQMQQLKKEIQDANWQRKQAQTHAGEKLRTLEANWVLLVSKNYEIEQRCVELEKKLHAERERQAVAQQAEHDEAVALAMEAAQREEEMAAEAAIATAAAQHEEAMAAAQQEETVAVAEQEAAASTEADDPMTGPAQEQPEGEKDESSQDDQQESQSPLQSNDHTSNNEGTP